MNKLESQIENGTCIPPTVWDITEKVNEIIDFLNKKECEDTEIAPPKHAVVTVEKKLRWSEEDEENLESLTIILQQARAKGISCEEEIMDLSDWLKSLRPQPKRDCKDCAMFLNGKCTKPRWKPSEEQMKALEGAIEIIRLEKEDSLIATVLESLLKQLKAL